MRIIQLHQSLHGRHFQKMLAQHCYRLPTKLREGNVFSHVCLSFCSQVAGSPHPSSPVQGFSLAPPRHLQLRPHYTRIPIPPFKFVPYKAQTVGKRAVNTLLKCLLVRIKIQHKDKEALPGRITDTVESRNDSENDTDPNVCPSCSTLGTSYTVSPASFTCGLGRPSVNSTRLKNIPRLFISYARLTDA